jgi:hypothetical protein
MYSDWGKRDGFLGAYRRTASRAGSGTRQREGGPWSEALCNVDCVVMCLWFGSY